MKLETPQTASPTHLVRSFPGVSITFLPALPVIDVEGYEVDSSECDLGEIIAGKFRLPDGVTDRYVERLETGYVDVNGEPVTGELVSWRYPTADELADWEQAKREQCATCDGTGFYRAWSDSGMGCVAPCHEDHPGAHECKHDGQLDQWRA